MKIKRLTIILIVIALVAGGAAAYGAKNYIEGAVAQYRAELESRYAKVKVAVAADNLPAGTQLGPANVVAREVPKEFLHKDAVRIEQWGQFNGRRSRADLTRGAPILRSHMLSANGGRFAQLLDSGKRALTVPVDKISSISGMLAPGDQVDILLTLRKDKEPVTFPLMKDLPVLATGVRTNELNQGPAAYNTVTLVVDPEQAAKIVHAREVGSLTVVLRAENDDSDNWPDRITLASLLGESKVVVKRRPARRIEVILGGQGLRSE